MRFTLNDLTHVHLALVALIFVAIGVGLFVMGNKRYGQELSVDAIRMASECERAHLRDAAAQTTNALNVADLNRATRACESAPALEAQREALKPRESPHGR